MTSNWLDGQVLLGNGLAFLIAAVGLLVIGAGLFHLRRTRTKTLARKLQP